MRRWHRAPAAPPALACRCTWGQNPHTLGQCSSCMLPSSVMAATSRFSTQSLALHTMPMIDEQADTDSIPDMEPA